MYTFRSVVLALSICIMMPTSARADIFDTFGFNAQGIAMAGARCVDVKDLSAVYYNPAGLGERQDHALELSYLYNDARMDVSDGATTVPDDSDLSGGSVIIALGLDIRQLINTSRKATFAFALSMMDDGTMVRLEDLEEQQYSYIQYGSSISRSVIYMGLGIEAIPEYLSIGIGAHAMIGGEVAATMTMGAQDLSTTQQVTPSEQNFWMKMEMKPYPTIGIIGHPTKNLSLGLSYRDSIDVKLDPFIADIALTLGAHAAHINAYTAILSFWHPASYQAGFAYTHGDLTLEGDLSYDQWSDFELSAPRELRRVTPSFDDVLSYRIGAEYRLAHVTLWAGYQYAPSPLPQDTGGSHYLDADRHILSLGIGTSYQDPWGVLRKPLGLSAAFQDQYLPERSFSAAGTDYSLKGNVISGIVSLKMTF